MLTKSLILTNMWQIFQVLGWGVTCICRCSAVLHCSFPKTPAITTTTNKKITDPSIVPFVSLDLTVSPLPQSSSPWDLRLFRAYKAVSRTNMRRWQICHFWGQPCHIYMRCLPTLKCERRGGGVEEAPVESEKHKFHIVTNSSNVLQSRETRTWGLSCHIK